MEGFQCFGKHCTCLLICYCYLWHNGKWEHINKLIILRKYIERTHSVKFDYICMCVDYLGYIEVLSTRKQTDEKGQYVRNHNNDNTFPAMRWPWLCCFRRWHAGEHPHRLWILRAILVGRPWQCFHCSPHGWSISG